MSRPFQVLAFEPKSFEIKIMPDLCRIRGSVWSTKLYCLVLQSSQSWTSTGNSKLARNCTQTCVLSTSRSEDFMQFAIYLLWYSSVDFSLFSSPEKSAGSGMVVEESHVKRYHLLSLYWLFWALFHQSRIRKIVGAPGIDAVFGKGRQFTRSDLLRSKSAVCPCVIHSLSLTSSCMNLTLCTIYWPINCTPVSVQQLDLSSIYMKALIETDLCHEFVRLWLNGRLHISIQDAHTFDKFHHFQFNNVTAKKLPRSKLYVR